MVRVGLAEAPARRRPDAAGPRVGEVRLDRQRRRADRSRRPTRSARGGVLRARARARRTPRSRAGASSRRGRRSTPRWRRVGRRLVGEAAPSMALARRPHVQVADLVAGRSAPIQWPDSSDTASAGCAASNVARRMVRSVRPRDSVRPKSPSRPSTLRGQRTSVARRRVLDARRCPARSTSEGSCTGCGVRRVVAARPQQVGDAPARCVVDQHDRRAGQRDLRKPPVARQQLPDVVGHAHALDASPPRGRPA